MLRSEIMQRYARI